MSTKHLGAPLLKYSTVVLSNGASIRIPLIKSSKDTIHAINVSDGSFPNLRALHIVLLQTRAAVNCYHLLPNTCMQYSNDDVFKCHMNAGYFQ